MIPTLQHDFTSSSGHQFMMKTLDQFAATEISYFIDKVRDTLPPANQHHLKKKSPEMLQGLHASGASFIGVFSSDNMMVGFAMLRPHPDNDEIGQIESFCTDASLRGQGIGKNLLKAVVHSAKDMYRILSARIAQDNEGSYRAFQDAGFCDVSEGHNEPGGYSFYIVARNFTDLTHTPTPKNNRGAEAPSQQVPKFH